MKELYRVLKNRGKLLISTPNLRSIFKLCSILFNNTKGQGAQDIFLQYEKLEKIGHMGHVREYFESEISTYLNNIGFNIRKVMYRGGFGSRRYDIPLKLFPQFKPELLIIAQKA